MSLGSLAILNTDSLRQLEVRLGHSFADPALLYRALIHRSYSFEKGERLFENEVLEFLGDAVLGLAIGHTLLRRFPEMREGELTRFRAGLVNEGHLALMASEIDLGPHLLLGKGEEMGGGREKPSILSSAYEAVVGAIFLDGGYEAAAAFIERRFAPYFSAQGIGLAQDDSKSALQEILQDRYGEGPSYVLDRAEGPDHQRSFHVSVHFRGKHLGSGQACSKKKAEQQAAANALAGLEAAGRVDA